MIRNTPCKVGLEVIRNSQFQDDYQIERNIQEMINYEGVEKPWGGFLPYPPESCPKKNFIFESDDGLKWIDLSICNYCDEIKLCNNRKNFLEFLADKRQVALQKLKEKKDNNDG